MGTKLTDLEVRNAKPQKEKYALSAGHGLTVIVMPDGSKYWRLRYRFNGKPKMIAVGKPRRKMMQEWANLLDRMASRESNVTPIRPAAA